MQTLLVIFHILVCVALIVIVLLQKGRGADIGALFGGSSQTLFGSTGGSTFFNKLTTAVAVIFMLTSLTLAYQSRRGGADSVMKGVRPAATAPAPAAQEGPTSEPAKAATGAEKEGAKQ
ncbi:MAG TPA: preprotein translocase subunit SecG [Syntrophobacteria bacterium]|nr:preprotein translocase subunit SecG [Syntrophobacteria bacterium]